MTAFLDGPDRPDISNPIHSTDVAKEYGFTGALVGGVTVYGWMVPPLLAVLGDEWLDYGWADVSFRKPVYPGDLVEARASHRRDGGADLRLSRGPADTCVLGTAGLGDAPWRAELTRPTRTEAEPPARHPELLTLESAPVGHEVRAMGVPIPMGEAAAYALEKQEDGSERWTGAGARIHPGWIAARMTPLMKHSYRYGPSIHTRSQVQHLAPAMAGQRVTIAGRFVDAFERNGHHYAVVDGLVLADGGEELAHIRHTTIFRIAPLSER